MTRCGPASSQRTYGSPGPARTTSRRTTRRRRSSTSGHSPSKSSSTSHGLEARTARAGYVRTLQWFCVRALCPTLVGTMVTYRDSTHITLTYARVLAGPLAAAMAVAIRG